MANLDNLKIADQIEKYAIATKDYSANFLTSSTN